MRLLTRDQGGEISLTDDIADNIPPYGILSHTWSKNNAEEVTFKDIQEGTWRAKPAAHKIEFCANQGSRDSLQYFWVDTCCIDKSTMDEVQESINSMFRWYRNATQCYVYLSDVSMNNPVGSDGVELSWEDAFRTSKWFTRGWTLQELLAPESVKFFSRESLYIGDKRSLQQAIHDITTIPTPALQKADSLNQFHADERLRWAETRETTREEDWVYCLLGIFGIFMPLNYGEGKDNAIKRLRMEIGNIPKRQEWLRKLYTCPYRDRKDRNPPRVKGTCEWFISHSLFQNWRQSDIAHLLWVSADPGCGKSVLARYLADEVLPSAALRTTCYFFFKEDFEDQRSSVIALRSILHQIFDHYPAFFSFQVLEKLQDKGDTLLNSFGDLWEILLSAVTGYQERQVICILDALDECDTKERNQLVDAICKLSQSTSSLPVKFLLTSRPYVDILRLFQGKSCDLSVIHLRGDNEQEVTKISSEIDLVIKDQVSNLSHMLGLIPKERDVLLEELTRMPNRTYLWVHLVFAELRNSILLTPDEIRSEIRSLPRTVTDAYEAILSKSQKPYLTRKLLHIVLAAERPLTLQEMALALKIGPQHRSLEDIDLVPEIRFRDDIRQLCGLFVVIVDSKIYLLHQTAREFLVPALTESPSPACSIVAKWKYSFHPKESNRILAEICLQRLALEDFNVPYYHNEYSQRIHPIRSLAANIFGGYSANHWASHFRETNWDTGHPAVLKATSCCCLGPQRIAWLEIYRLSREEPIQSDDAPLIIASYFGLSPVVERLLRGVDNINTIINRESRTAAFWASSGGYHATLQLLLEAGADVNIQDKYRSTPLHLASRAGHSSVVQQLLTAGADVNNESQYGLTPLHHASEAGHGSIVQQLLAAGADVNNKSRYGLTPLHYASEAGHSSIVQQLLTAGADVDNTSQYGPTPLHHASEAGHGSIVQQLLAAGADVNNKSLYGLTPLHHASEAGHSFIVKQLLASGADANNKSRYGLTPLHHASEAGHGSVVQQLLAAGADVNIYEILGSTALHLASKAGHSHIVQQLLAAGADISICESLAPTALHLAHKAGHDTIVNKLRDARA